MILNIFIKILGIALFIAVLVLFVSYICFRIVFYVPGKPEVSSDELPVPTGKIYEPYHHLMRRWIKEARGFQNEDFYIKSFDGLTLHAKYFEYAPGAVTEIMFHGYRGSAERDLSGGIQRCFALGRNVLLVDQRTSCGSEGNVISFGINEHRDCLSWIDFAVKHFGSYIKLVLTGISMGASTVLMAAGKPLPENWWFFVPKYLKNDTRQSKSHLHRALGKFTYARCASLIKAQIDADHQAMNSPTVKPSGRD